jgi:6-phosphogluconate dehydrogenase
MQHSGKRERHMQIGFVGLGKMGGNMVERLLRDKHDVVVYNRTMEKVEQAVSKGAIGSSSLGEMTSKLTGKRIVWLMVPAGEPVDTSISSLLPLLKPGDVIIDGGNSYYKDTVRRNSLLKEKGLEYLDCGTSGGIWGLKVGYCLMIGGSRTAFKSLEPIFKTLAPPEGYLHCGESGAGHLVKMIHNGVEYGMMQAYAEGFDILKASPYGLNLQKIAHLWNQGSVVRSWLLELAELALQKDPALENLEPFVADSGEGRSCSCSCPFSPDAFCVA